MQNLLPTRSVIRTSLALALGLAIWSPVQPRSEEAAEGKMMMKGNMMERCEAMKQQKHAMKEEMKAQDAQLTEELATMNRATGDEKMGLMASLITHMLEQRIAMDAQHARMEDQMMGHMMQHMQMGKDSMSECPMMKGMKGMKGMDHGSESHHTEHQEEQK